MGIPLSFCHRSQRLSRPITGERYSILKCGGTEILLAYPESPNCADTFIKEIYSSLSKPGVIFCEFAVKKTSKAITIIASLLSIRCSCNGEETLFKQIRSFFVQQGIYRCQDEFEISIAMMD